MHVVFAKSSADPRDALQRLQSTPLHDGLRELGQSAAMAVLDGGPVNILPPSHVVVHYNDLPAAAAAFDLRKQRPLKIICLCSDVYTLAPYRKLAEIVDLFLAPTPLHRLIIQSAVTRPVAVLPEAIDPIALPGQGPDIPVACNEAVCWFGYPESFDKSMRHLLPDAMRLSGAGADRFTLITEGGEALWPAARHWPFSERTFYQDSAGSGYALLSHFAYDLRLNSFIKSPNKMVTALVRGMVPLASATPAYQQLAQHYGLGELLYDGPFQLGRLLSEIDCWRDRQRFGLEAIRQDLLFRHAPAALGQRFLELIS